MATKKQNENLKDFLANTPAVWAARTTGSDEEFIFIVNINGVPHVVVTKEIHNEEEGDKLVFLVHDDSLRLKKTIKEMLYTCFALPKNLKEEFSTVKTFKKYEVSYDYNQALYSSDIRSLSKEYVEKILDKEGVNHSSYVYTEIKIDNSFTIKASTVPTGYKNYPDECIHLAKNVDKYKTYKIEDKEIFDMLDKGCYKGIIAAGPAGTGKTTAFFADSAQKEIPVFDFQCVHNTEAEDIIGKYVPATDPYSVKRKYLESLLAKEDLDEKERKDAQKELDALPPVPTGYEFVYGPLSLAVKFDCRFSGQEWNYAPTAVQSLVNSIMDDNGSMTLPNGEVLTVGPNFRMFLTVNPGYRGTNMFNEATLNRFVTIYFPPITKETLIERLTFETGYKNIKVLECIAEQFENIRDLYKNSNKDTEITYRNVSRFLKMRLLSPEVSIEKQFDMAFITNAIFEMDDIEVELSDLQKIRKEYVEKISAAEKASTISSVPDGSFHVELPSVDIDDDLDLDLDLEDASVEGLDEE